jgi:hypothetical protein
MDSRRKRSAINETELGIFCKIVGIKPGTWIEIDTHKIQPPFQVSGSVLNLFIPQFFMCKEIQSEQVVGSDGYDHLHGFLSSLTLENLKEGLVRVVTEKEARTLSVK